MTTMQRQSLGRFGEVLMRETIYALRSRGLGYAEIARRLNGMGVTGRGGPDGITPARVRVIAEESEDRIEVGPSEASRLSAGLLLLRLSLSGKTTRPKTKARRVYDTFCKTLATTNDLQAAVDAAEDVADGGG